MHVLVHKSRVLVGPMTWNRAMFEGALERLGIKALLPLNEPETIPVMIDDDTYVSGCQINVPEHNPRTETYYGPFWNFDDPRISIGTYNIKTKELWDIKNYCKEQASSNRYTHEVAGTTITLQAQTVSLDTSRDGRAIFLQKLSLMPDDCTVNWKFPETWLTLTKQELAACVAAGAAHIQSCFDWEKQKWDEIEQADSVETLAAMDLNIVSVATPE